MKYEIGETGVPRRRFSVPKSRSIGIMIASCWKPVLTRPDAIIPATKYWLKVTPGARSPLKTEPKMNNNMTGKRRVNTTDSRWRMNCFISRPPRRKPTLIMFGLIIAQSFSSKYLQVMVESQLALELRHQILQIVLQLRLPESHFQSLV